MIRIGISGWIYPGWRGSFYPDGLPQRSELSFASRRFDTIEINGTFYSLKTPQSFRRWCQETPPGFVFAVKGGRFITHMKRLKEVEVPLANFYASGVLTLGAKLGPILWQFPADFRLDPENFTRIERFLGLLPRDTGGAQNLAARHDRRVRGRAALGPFAARPIRHALEVRHESFREPRFLDLLRRAGVALVVSDAPSWPRFEEVTADFMYLRLHGAEELYRSGYDDKALDRWAKLIRRWAAGGRGAAGKARRSPSHNPRPRDVYVYFDNDAKVLAPRDAAALRRRLPGTERESRGSAGRGAEFRPAAKAAVRRRSGG